LEGNANIPSMLQKKIIISKNLKKKCQHSSQFLFFKKYFIAEKIIAEKD
jgi:hypothetical protein